MIKKLTCPKCGGILDSKRTYTDEDRTVYRTRICRDCGFKYRSIEKEFTNGPEFDLMVCNLRSYQYRKRKSRAKTTKSEFRQKLELRNNEIFERYNNGVRIKDLAYEYQLTRCHIHSIIRTKRGEQNGTTK